MSALFAMERRVAAQRGPGGIEGALRDGACPIAAAWPIIALLYCTARVGSRTESPRRSMLSGGWFILREGQQSDLCGSNEVNYLEI